MAVLALIVLVIDIEEKTLSSIFRRESCRQPYVPKLSVKPTLAFFLVTKVAVFAFYREDC
jgi:hypothetical protein